jgi:hypothetical protein
MASQSSLRSQQLTQGLQQRTQLQQQRTAQQQQQKYQEEIQKSETQKQQIKDKINELKSQVQTLEQKERGPLALEYASQKYGVQAQLGELQKALSGIQQGGYYQNFNEILKGASSVGQQVQSSSNVSFAQTKIVSQAQQQAQKQAINQTLKDLSAVGITDTKVDPKTGIISYTLPAQTSPSQVSASKVVTDAYQGPIKQGTSEDIFRQTGKTSGTSTINIPTNVGVSQINPLTGKGEYRYSSGLVVPVTPQTTQVIQQGSGSFDIYSSSVPTKPQTSTYTPQKETFIQRVVQKTSNILESPVSRGIMATPVSIVPSSKEFLTGERTTFGEVVTRPIKSLDVTAEYYGKGIGFVKEKSYSIPVISSLSKGQDILQGQKRKVFMGGYEFASPYKIDKDKVPKVISFLSPITPEEWEKSASTSLELGAYAYPPTGGVLFASSAGKGIERVQSPEKEAKAILDKQIDEVILQYNKEYDEALSNLPEGYELEPRQLESELREELTEQYLPGVIEQVKKQGASEFLISAGTLGTIGTIKGVSAFKSPFVKEIEGGYKITTPSKELFGSKLVVGEKGSPFFKFKPSEEYLKKVTSEVIEPSETFGFEIQRPFISSEGREFIKSYPKVVQFAPILKESTIYSKYGMKYFKKELIGSDIYSLKGKRLSRPDIYEKIKIKTQLPTIYEPFGHKVIQAGKPFMQVGKKMKLSGKLGEPKFKIVGSEGEYISIKDMMSLDKTSKYTLGKTIEGGKLGGTPLKIENIPKFISDEELVYLGTGKTYTLTKPLGKKTELFRQTALVKEGSSIPTAFGDIKTYNIWGGSKSVSKPFARATGKVDLIKGRVVVLPGEDLSGGGVVSIGSSGITKTPLSQTFKLESSQLLNIKPKPTIIRTPKIPTKTTLISPIKAKPISSITSITGLSAEQRAESIYAGTGQYERTSEFGVVSPIQLPGVSNNVFVKEPSSITPFSPSKILPSFRLSPIQQEQFKSVQGKINPISPLSSSIPKLKLNLMQGTSPSESSRSLLYLATPQKQIPRLNLLQAQVQTQIQIPSFNLNIKPRRIEPPFIKPRIKIKPFFLPLGVITSSSKRGKSTSETPFTFEYKKRGKTLVSPVAFRSEKEAEEYAKRFALKSAVASIRPIRAKSGQKIIKSPFTPNLRTDVLFRKGRGGFLVQKERLRILTPGEKRETSYLGAKVRRTSPSKKRKKRK